MSWYQPAIEGLARGERVAIRPHGNSMSPKVRSGDRVLLAPIAADEDVAVGDIVLVRVRGTVYLHLVKAVAPDRVLIGNNHGGVNGWTGRAKVFGRAVEVEGRRV